MQGHVLSAAVFGVDAYPVSVEVDLAGGLPEFITVGLAEGAVRESKMRVKSAISSCGYAIPSGKVITNLAPADRRKDGSAFDLPIAVGIVAAMGILRKTTKTQQYILLGELSLDGRIQPIRGVLPVAAMARERGIHGIILPIENAAEAGIVEGLDIRPAKHLSEVIGFLQGRKDLAVYVRQPLVPSTSIRLDFLDVQGQESAKRALEIAAAGGHNALLMGPPGSGKSLLARRLPSILPPMNFEEALETTKIYSVVGLLGHGQSLIQDRPFRAPHHTVSDAGLIGGGSFPRPGELSLSHHGVLFLDELPEFKRSALEVLRQPLEERRISIARAQYSVSFPASTMLLAAMNPCPCGYLGDEKHKCSCTKPEIQRYRARISGPMLDRIDLHVNVPSVPYKALANTSGGESSASIRERVMRAREIQQQRLQGTPARCNADMTPMQLRQYSETTPEGLRLLEAVVDKLGFSARAHDRVRRVARTIADLDQSQIVEARHLAEAIQYRFLDRTNC